MKYLLVIDMQKDFVDGALGSSRAQAIVPNVIAKIKSFDGDVLLTRDTHDENYLQTEEGKNLPTMHCIKNTPGWEFVDSIRELQEKNNYPIFEKTTFGSLSLIEYIKKNSQKENIDSLELIGLCTDICVISNALLIKANFENIPLFVDPACCSGVTEESHIAALKVLENCGIHLI